MLFQDPQIVTIGDKSCKMFAPDEFIDKTNSVLYNTSMPDKKKIPFWIYYNSDNIGPDLHIEEFGFGISTPGYTFTETRNNYLLEFVLNGLTHVSVEKSPLFSVQKGEAFLLPPHIPHLYTDDKKIASERAWISWSGNSAGYIADTLQTLSNPHHIKVANPDAVKIIFNKLQKARTQATPLILQRYSYFFNLISLCAKNDCISQSDSEETILINDMMHYLDKNICDAPSVSDLSRYFGYDASSIFRKFKKHTGLSPKEYILHQRLALSKSLIRETSLSFDEIAARCGYIDKNSLNKLFMRHLDMSLWQYKKMCRIATEAETSTPKGFPLPR